MKKEKKPQNKKKGLIIGIIAVAAVVFLLASPFIFYSGPTSMQPAKWTDAVYAQSVNVDFSGSRTVTVTGNLEGKEVSASYTVTVENDQPVVVCTQSAGEEAALAKLDGEIMPYVLLTFGKSTEIVDKLTVGGFGDDIICMLQKFTFEIWRGDEEQGNATSELLTWGEDLALQSFTVVTRPEGTPVSGLTFTWN